MPTTDHLISDMRLETPFTAYVLLDAPLAFAVADVVAGLAEIYPAISWRGGDDGQYRTNDAFRTELSGRVAVTLTSAPGRLPGTLEVPVRRSKMFEGAADAVARHQSYIAITAESKGARLIDRFIAAQHVTCVAALFAAMSNATAVFFASADQLVAPKTWVDGAATAHLDEWPIEHWVSFHLSKVHQAEATVPEFSCGSIGMAAFTGHEVSFPLAPVSPADAAKAVCGGVYLMSTGSDLFARAAAIDLDDGYPPLAVRHLKEGEYGAQTHAWLLIHPTSRLYDAEIGTGSDEAPVIHREGLVTFTVPKRSQLN